jgi:hypothetical protein
MRTRVNRVTSAWDESSELRRRLIRDDTSGEELLVFDKSRGYIFYTMRGGLNNR